MTTDNRREYDLAEIHSAADQATATSTGEQTLGRVTRSTGTEDARYLWHGIVWAPSRTVPVTPNEEPPEFVLAFRAAPAGAYLLERQAPAADGSSRWAWVDKSGSPIGEPDQPWHDVLDTTSLTVARVKMPTAEFGHGSESDPATQARRDVVQVRAIPFNPFPRPVARPAEPEVGTVIGFTKKFSEDGTSYLFAAIHAVKGRWYPTGPQYGGRPLSWDALLDFIGGPLEWARVGAVGSWDRLEDL
jgi:hypothetical protein